MTTKQIADVLVFLLSVMGIVTMVSLSLFLLACAVHRWIEVWRFWENS